MQIIPLRFKTPISIEHLNPMIFAIRHVDPAILVTTDIMRQIKLAWAATRPAPRFDEPAIRREFMNAGIPIAIGGTTSNPTFAPNMGGLLGGGTKSAKGAAKPANNANPLSNALGGLFKPH